MSLTVTLRHRPGQVVTWEFPAGMIGAVHLLAALTGAVADSSIVEALLRRGLARRGLLR